MRLWVQGPMKQAQLQRVQLRLEPLRVQEL